MATPTFTDNLRKHAQRLNLAETRFEKTFNLWRNKEVKPCDDETGWKILDAFRHEVGYYYFDLRRYDVGIEHAAWELFRKCLTGECNHTIGEILQFVEWYGVLTSRISKAFRDLSLDRGDDSFGDLTDSLPLAGRKIVERCLATDPRSGKPKREGFLEAKELYEAIKSDLSEDWYKLICEGENYVEMALSDSAKKAVLNHFAAGDK